MTFITTIQTRLDTHIENYENLAEKIKFDDFYNPLDLVK